MSFRFVHAADLHLDSPLKSLALRDPALADLIGTATRSALAAIVDLCLAEKVDALLIAGDLYDGDQTSMTTARFLAWQLGRLDRAGIAVHIIRGNHDALSKITRELVLPDSTHVYRGKAEAVVLDRPDSGVPVVLHGLSFKDARVDRSLLGDYRPPTPDAVNIGLMHTSLGGSPDHDPYAPVSAAELGAAGFDYWALGHIHKPARHMVGRTHVVMPGNPQGRDIGEAGPRGVVLVTVHDDRSISIEDRVTSTAEFAQIVVDAAGLTDWTALVGRIASALGTARDAARSAHLVARVRLTGATPLAWRIRRDLDLLAGEAANEAAALGAVWIDKLTTDCALPGETQPEVADGPPLHTLRRLIGTEVLAAPRFQDELLQIAEALTRQLPGGMRHILGNDRAEVTAALAALAAEGADEVVARLSPDNGSAG